MLLESQSNLSSINMVLSPFRRAFGSIRGVLQSLWRENVNRLELIAPIALSFFLIASLNGCSGNLSVGSAPPYPHEPPPLSFYSVEFVPADTKRYPATRAKDVKRYRNVVHYSGKSEIRTDEKPTRPYVRVGELRFGLNWYYSSNIKELIDTHVPRIGGDAVLVYNAYDGGAAALVKDDATGKMKNVFYQSIVVEVIRYTDK